MEEELLLLKLDVKINVYGGSSRAVRPAKITRLVVLVGSKQGTGRLADVLTEAGQWA